MFIDRDILVKSASPPRPPHPPSIELTQEVLHTLTLKINIPVKNSTFSPKVCLLNMCYTSLSLSLFLSLSVMRVTDCLKWPFSTLRVARLLRTLFERKGTEEGKGKEEWEGRRRGRKEEEGKGGEDEDEEMEKKGSETGYWTDWQTNGLVARVCERRVVKIIVRANSLWEG